MKSWLQGNDIERFIRTLKTKIYKCMTSIPTYVYNDKLDDIVDIYIYTCTLYIYIYIYIHISSI